jgi:hypothetical protein
VLERSFFPVLSKKMATKKKTHKAGVQGKKGGGGGRRKLGRRTATRQLNNDNHRHESKRDSARCRYSWTKLQRHSTNGSYQPKSYETGPLTSPLIGRALGETSRTSHKKPNQLQKPNKAKQGVRGGYGKT